MAKGKFGDWLNEEGLTLLSGWARDGLTDEDIANNVGIAVSTFYEWKIRYPEISEALKKSKEIADRIVENALFKRATGYSQETVKVFQYKGEPVVISITEHIIPDVTAQIFWLKNRKPQEWRDKRETSEDDSSEIQTGVVILPAVLPDDETDEEV